MAARLPCSCHRFAGRSLETSHSCPWRSSCSGLWLVEFLALQLFQAKRCRCWIPMVTWQESDWHMASQCLHFYSPLIFSWQIWRIENDCKWSFHTKAFRLWVREIHKWSAGLEGTFSQEVLLTQFNQTYFQFFSQSIP